MPVCRRRASASRDSRWSATATTSVASHSDVSDEEEREVLELANQFARILTSLQREGPRLFCVLSE